MLAYISTESREKLFKLGALLSVGILFLPSKWLMAVYTPSILGFLWMFLFIPCAILFFLVLSFSDLYYKRFKAFFSRLLLVIALLAVAAIMIYLKQQFDY